MSIIKHLKQTKVQFYVVSDREIPIKVIIRGLQTSTDIEEVKENLSFKGFTVFKISQLKNLIEGKKLLPLFLLELPKNETRIFNTKSLY